MKGERVEIFRREQVSTDSMGEPEYEWLHEQISNVLVCPVRVADVSNGERPDGIEIKYRLAFPKTFKGSLRHARIALIDRSMELDPDVALHVIGDPDIVFPCPTPWNRLVDVGRRDG